MHELEFFNDKFKIKLIIDDGSIWVPVNDSIYQIGYTSELPLIKEYCTNKPEIRFYDNPLFGKVRYIVISSFYEILNGVKQTKKVKDFATWLETDVAPEVNTIFNTIMNEQEVGQTVTLVHNTTTETINSSAIINDKKVGEIESMSNLEPVNPIQNIFNYNDHEIRIIMIDNEPWFVAKDICSVLETVNVSQAVDKLDDDEKGICSIDTLGGTQEMSVVSEPGLYTLTLKSRKPEAKPFRRWVTHEVLPSIRKTGSYSVDDIVSQTPVLAEYLAMDENERGMAYFATKTEVKQLQLAQEIITEENTILSQQNQKMKPKAEFFDTIIDVDQWFTVGEVAKMIGMKNLGQNNLFKYLINAEIFMANNEPYQDHVNAGYFKVVQTKVERKDGNIYINGQTVVSERGINYILKRIKKDGYSIKASA